MKAVILGPYPTYLFKDKLQLTKLRFEHSCTWIKNLVKALSKFPDLELHLVTLAPNLTKSQRIEELSVNYHFIKRRRERYGGGLSTLYQFDKIMIQEELKVIHPHLIHSFGTEDIYSFAAVASGFPSIIHMQGIITECLKARRYKLDNTGIRWFLIQFLERYTIKKGKYFFTRTQLDTAFVRNLCNNAVIFNIWEPVDEAFFKVKRNNKNRSTILFIGRVSQFKGIEELLTAFSELIKHFPGLKLRIIGSANSVYIGDLLKKRNFSLINKAIDICGFKTSQEIAAAFKDASMVVVPSYMENSPNVVCEAMVAGVPVIASNVGGIPSIITHRETGLLVEPKNPKVLAEAIRCLIDHPDVAEKMAQNAKSIARKRHHPDYVAIQVRNAYRQVLQMEEK